MIHRYCHVLFQVDHKNIVPTHANRQRHRRGDNCPDIFVSNQFKRYGAF